jgi:hypothetical protein
MFQDRGNTRALIKKVKGGGGVNLPSSKAEYEGEGGQLTQFQSLIVSSSLPVHNTEPSGEKQQSVTAL